MYGGVASTEVSSPSFGGSFGVNVTPDFLIFGELGRSQDVKAPFTAEDLSLVQQGLAAEGIPFTSNIKMAVNYYSGGIKYFVPVSRAFRPYISANGGLAHMSPEVTFTAFGIDVTSAALSSGMNANFHEDTRPMAGLTTGVAITAGHVMFDVGYKYSAIFVASDYLQDPTSPHNHTTINMHQFTGGVGFRF